MISGAEVTVEADRIEGERWAEGLRVFYLTPGGLHDRRYLAALQGVGFEILYVHLIDGMQRHCLPGIRSVNLGYRPVYGGSAFHQLARMILKLPYVPRVRHLLHSFQPHILHSGWILTTGFWAALADFHPFFLHCFGSDLRTRATNSWWLRRVARFTLRRADAITCDTRQTFDIITREAGVPGSRVHCFPFGVDLDLFRPDPILRNRVRKELGWEESVIVIHARALEPLYDPFTFLRAFRSAHAQAGFSRLKALVAGTGSLVASLREAVRNWGIQDDVVFLGDVPQDKLVGYLNAADVMVSCPLDDGSSNSVLEGMACGLPVLASDLPAMRELNEPAAGMILIPVGDSGRLAWELLSLMRDLDQARRMGGENLRVAAQRADRARNSDRFLEIYRSLIGNGNSSGADDGGRVFHPREIESPW